MKKIVLFLAVAVFAGCSSSDDAAKVELYLTSDGAQRPFFAETTQDVNADGENAILVYADRTGEQLNFDVVVGATGDNVVEHVEFIPNVSEGTVYQINDVFYSNVSVNSDTRLKGVFSGNLSDGTVEKYIECTFDVKKNASN
ncbi:hypothetical protein [Flavobacterium sp.]|uniref:hypothetical protein n=1 Tax=Flavobacterium sp. TaxID=239 RepID=UPI0011FDC1E8|nr:hypothetical protein [Flavobacterium sp.]RZJ69642.1 MAG: hypothetical protein EOO49_16560 [Flavobacterium sp.]